MKTDKRVKSTNPPFKKIQTELYKFKDNVGWKDVIPTLLSWIEQNQPKDTNYDLKFWLKEYKIK